MEDTHWGWISIGKMICLILKVLGARSLWYKLSYIFGRLYIDRKVEVIGVDVVAQGRTCRVKGTGDEAKTVEAIPRAQVYSLTAVLKVQVTLNRPFSLNQSEGSQPCFWEISSIYSLVCKTRIRYALPLMKHETSECSISQKPLISSVHQV